MTPVHFVGAGPGAPDLITLRGRELLARADLCLYAGSLVPEPVLVHGRRGLRLIDTRELTLDRIIDEIARGHGAGESVVRLHSGDTSIYSAAAEQMRRLDACGIPYDITPGVTAFSAAAAVLSRELTLPGVGQTVILTRISSRSTPMPAGESLAELATHRSTLVVHLAVQEIERVVEEVLPAYGADCPVAVVAYASRPEETVLRGVLGEIAAAVRAADIRRTAVIVVGPVLGRPEFRDSHLYSAGRDRSRQG